MCAEVLQSGARGLTWSRLVHALSRQHWAHISSLFSFDRVLFPMYTKIKVNLVMCCGCFLGCGKGMEIKFLMRNYTMNSCGKRAWVDGAPYLHSWKLNVIQEFVCLLVQYMLSKIKTGKSHWRQVETEVFISRGMLFGDRNVALLSCRKLALSKVVLGVVPQVSSWLLRDPRPKDCMSTGIQDRQDHRATFLPQAYRCPGPCRQNCAFWTWLRI